MKILATAKTQLKFIRCDMQTLTGLKLAEKLHQDSRYRVYSTNIFTTIYERIG